MDDNPWRQLVESISHPMDWLGAAVGSAAGATLTFVAAGLEMGASTAVGGSLGIGVSKAVRRAMRGPALRRRINGLRSTFKSYAAHDLLEQLNREVALWESKGIDNDGLQAALDSLVARFRDDHSDVRKD